MTRTRVLTLVLVLLVGGVVGYWIWPWAGPTTGLSGAAGFWSCICAKRSSSFTPFAISRA